MSNTNDAFDNLMNEYMDNEEASPADVDPAASEDNEDPAEESDDSEEQEAPKAEDEDPADEGDGSEEDEDEDEDEEDPDEESGDEKPESKRKSKKSAQERINEVVAQRRQIQRELENERAESARKLSEAQAELEQLRAKTQTPAPKQTEDAKAGTTPAGDRYGLKEPTPEDLDANGEIKYPLGAFDPNFMRDINRYDRAVERAYEAEVNQARAVETARQKEEQALFDSWNAKLEVAKKTSPQILDKAQNLVDTFEGGNPEHLQGIARTIMELDNGPQVLEYLADNLDEAESVVNSSPTKALVMLGRIDAMFLEHDEDTPAPLKPTSAPKPPTNLARGKSGGKQTSATMYDKMLREFN